MASVPSASGSTQPPEEPPQPQQPQKSVQPPEPPPFWINWKPDSILNPYPRPDGTNADRVANGKIERPKQEGWVRTAMEDIIRKGGQYVGCDVINALHRSDRSPLEADHCTIVLYNPKGPVTLKHHVYADGTHNWPYSASAGAYRGGAYHGSQQNRR